MLLNQGQGSAVGMDPCKLLGRIQKLPLLPRTGAGLRVLPAGPGITSLGRFPLGRASSAVVQGTPGPHPSHSHHRGASTPLQLFPVLPTWL